jgi:hypothetical protein
VSFLPKVERNELGDYDDILGGWDTEL